MTFLDSEDGELSDSQRPVSGTRTDADDPVRLYLREVGMRPLLTAEQEAEIGRRIEGSQVDALRALAVSPIVLTSLLEIGDRLRREQVCGNEVIVLREGSEVGQKDIQEVRWPSAASSASTRKSLVSSGDDGSVVRERGAAPWPRPLPARDGPFSRS